jgi:hypothetical protein
MMTLPDFEQILDESLLMLGNLQANDAMRVMARLSTCQLVLVSCFGRKPLAPVVPLPDARRTVKSAEAARLLNISPALLNEKVNTEPAYKALLVNNGSRIRSYYVDRIERMMAEKVR